MPEVIPEIEQLTMQNRTNVTVSPELSEVEQLTHWMFEKIQRHIQGSILEIGSGIGNISNLVIKGQISITLSDQDAYYCKILEERFRNDPMVEAILQINLIDEDFEHKYAGLSGKFDTVFALNIMDHTPVNQLSLANAKKLVRGGGNLIILLPAYTALYKELDPGFDHWHKCNKQRVRKILAQDFSIISMRYFNILGIVREFFSSKLQGKNTESLHHLKMYHKMVPMFRIEDLAFKQIGLSVITVAQKIK